MAEEQTSDFSSELLVVEDGVISSEAGKYAIKIKLCRFNCDGEDVNATLGINNLILSGKNVGDLAGKEFLYPPNPNDGYVETSIYIWSVHNPIDVIGIKFGKVESGTTEATFDMRFIFEYEGCCDNLDKILFAKLNIV